ncbi:glycosyltransferase family 4 protein [Methanobacterium formicicum]|uniref:glycosyltransferase family 4 protein n=1 Tax=Methanobacterium formicicum TaxID=2162 RepID=UPI002412CE3A|nr:glycosyltransferase family 4 protein [Methanobacterium formicicum]MDG3547074.1 glycosyltransferase family 4 protein [Methanobacterium formicicum]
MTNSSDPTKILIVSQHFPPDKSGNASRIYDISVNLSLDDVDVKVLAPFPSFPHGNFEKKNKIIKRKRINSNLTLINIFAWQPSIHDPGFISRILYYMTFPIHAVFWGFRYSKNYDVIITSSPPIFTAIPGLFVNLFFKKKWIFDCRDMWIEASISLGFIKKGSFTEKISKKFLFYCLNKADIIFVTTDGIKDKLFCNYKINKPIKIVPNGVDTQVFYPISTNKCNQIIYSGNVGHAQDLENCILAMKNVTKNHDLKLIIVGDGDIKSRLQEIVRVNGMEQSVIFKGLVSRKEIPKMISESLIGLAPLKKLESLDYAAPTKVYEYMACKIPFLGCGAGEIERIAKDSKAGIISDNTPESIAFNICELIQNRELREKMGQNGLEYVKNNYDRKTIASKVKKITEGL